MLSNPIFEIKWSQLNEQELWEHYSKCLEQHDWPYQYSDDHRYWVNGQVERDYLDRMKESLKKLDKKRANKIYFGHSPFHNDDGTLRPI